MGIDGFLPHPGSQVDDGKSIQQLPNQVVLQLTNQQRQLILSKHLWWPISKPTAKKVDWLFIGKTLNEVQSQFSDKIKEAETSQTSFAILLRKGKSQPSIDVFIQPADVNVECCQKVFSSQVDLPEVHWLQLGGKEIFDQHGEAVAAKFDARPWPQPRNFWTGEPHSVTVHLEQLVFLKNALSMRSGLTCIVGVSNWKYRCLLPFFDGSSGDVKRAKNYIPLKDCRYIYWGARPSKINKNQLLEGSQIIIVEDGFIRSLGLGVLGEAPLSIICDEDHLYFDARGESRLEIILQTTQFDKNLIDRAAKLQQKMISTRLSKYNLKKKSDQALATVEGQTKILVVGQVENDKSIEFGGAQIKKNKDLLKVVRQTYPTAYIAYKPHPDTLTGLRPGQIDDKTIAENCDQYLTNHDIIDAIEWCDTVCTITSLTGFEALMRGRRVVCYGQPFYAGWGLTDDVFPVARRTAKRSVEELIAAALILYPQYLHPPTQLPCTPEVLFEWLVQKQQEKTTMWQAISQKITMIERYALVFLGTTLDRLRSFGKNNSRK